METDQQARPSATERFDGSRCQRRQSSRQGLGTRVGFQRDDRRPWYQRYLFVIAMKNEDARLRGCDHRGNDGFSVAGDDDRCIRWQFAKVLRVQKSEKQCTCRGR